ncbi:hypothetical protein H4R33_006924 [Dimargaris cristalligena]|nr:hypothetical protein H4R33_006924 [Dimargaris cristalligena]
MISTKLYQPLATRPIICGDVFSTNKVLSFKHLAHLIAVGLASQGEQPDINTEPYTKANPADEFLPVPEAALWEDESEVYTPSIDSSTPASTPKRSSSSSSRYYSPYCPATPSGDCALGDIPYSPLTKSDSSVAFSPPSFSGSDGKDLLPRELFPPRQKNCLFTQDASASPFGEPLAAIKARLAGQTSSNPHLPPGITPSRLPVPARRKQNQSPPQPLSDRLDQIMKGVSELDSHIKLISTPQPRPPTTQSVTRLPNPVTGRRPTHPVTKTAPRQQGRVPFSSVPSRVNTTNSSSVSRGYVAKSSARNPAQASRSSAGKASAPANPLDKMCTGFAGIMSPPIIPVIIGGGRVEYRANKPSAPTI